jgi:carboxylesterase type B
MDYWVAFASSGSPEVAGRPQWPVYTASRPRVMELGERIGVIEPPDAELCRYLGPERGRP